MAMTLHWKNSWFNPERYVVLDSMLYKTSIIKDAYEPKWVNPNFILYGVNLLWFWFRGLIYFEALIIKFNVEFEKLYQIYHIIMHCDVIFHSYF